MFGFYTNAIYQLVLFTIPIQSTLIMVPSITLFLLVITTSYCFGERGWRVRDTYYSVPCCCTRCKIKGDQSGVNAGNGG